MARALDGFAAFGMSAPVYWVGAMTVVFFHPEVGQIARLPISKPNTYRPLTDDPLAWLQSCGCRGSSSGSRWPPSRCG